MQLQYIVACGGVIFTLVLTVVNSNQGNKIVNCANCFAQNWEWSSWQCDVNCNVETSPYGLFFLLMIFFPMFIMLKTIT